VVGRQRLAGRGRRLEACTQTETGRQAAKEGGQRLMHVCSLLYVSLMMAVFKVEHVGDNVTERRRVYES
jgi:hypothetical protein